MARLRIVLANVGCRHPFPYVSPPLGLMYLAAHARTRLDLEIRIVDQRLEDWSNAQLIDRILAETPDVVGFCSATRNSFLLPELVAGVRRGCPETLILLGGPHATAAGAQAIAATSADAAVVGEGELSFEQILRARIEGADFSGIPGLVWRDRTGEVITNPGAPPVVEDLDSLPFPAYDLIDVKRYWQIGSFCNFPPPRRYVTLFSSRGCPYRCNYCHKVFGKKFRAHSPERVLEEIERFTRESGANDVEFVDDIFNFDANRAVEICGLIRRRNLKIKLAFPNALRADILTEDVVDALADAGTYASAFAIETGSPRLQTLIGKHLNIPKAIRGIEMAVNRRIYSWGYFMLGFPTETAAEIEQTIDVACGTKLHRAWFFSVTPYPNTELYRLAEEVCPEKLAATNHINADYMFRPAANLSTVSDQEFQAYLRKALFRFLSSPTRLARVLRDYPGKVALARHVPAVLANALSQATAYTRKRA